MSRMPQKMQLESMRLEQSALIELFDVDLTSLGGDMLRFHNGINEVASSVVWKGDSYHPYPAAASGFNMSGTGPSNRPQLVLGNLTGYITGLINDFDDLVGTVVTRRLVYAKHLDAVNFKEGNNHADPTQEIVSRYIIEKTLSLQSDFATFEMSLPSEMDGAVIPARIITTDICSWSYRSADCGYTGGPCANEKDEPTTEPNEDKCGKRLGSCKLRFGDNAALPFGGFPSAARVSL